MLLNKIVQSYKVVNIIRNLVIRKEVSAVIRIAKSNAVQGHGADLTGIIDIIAVIKLHLAEQLQKLFSDLHLLGEIAKGKKTDLLVQTEIIYHYLI